MTTATTATDTATGAPPPHPSETVRDLPLSALTLSERNVRTIDDTPAELASLKASILAHGPIQNLAVRPVGKLYEVIAGKRRFRAMRELADEGEIHPDMMVACRILDESTNDTEISLAENEARVRMHVVDQVTAFRRLTEEGVARDRIAERFGISERTVDQRLRLGGLPAEILDAARDGQVKLEHLHAFAVTADQGRQLEVWNRIKDQDYTPGAHWIRAELTRSNVKANHSRARFVGIDAYTAAGGRIEADLFSDGEDERAMLIDPDILDRLAGEKLQQVADDLKAQGWKWAEPHLELEWDAAQKYGRLRGTPVGATAGQAAELERIEKRIAEIDDQLQKITDTHGEDDIDLPDDHAFYTLQDEREGLYDDDNRIRVAIDQNVTYTPEQMACAGCLVTIDQFNGLSVQAGLVREADAGDLPQPPDPAGDGAEQAGDDPGNTPAPDGYTPPVKRPAAKNPETEAVKSAGLSNTLAEELRLIRNALVKAHLANDFEAAFDLTAYEMSVSAFGSRIYGARPLAMTLNGTADRPLGSPDERSAFEAASPGIELLERDRAELPLDWLDEQDPGRRFLAFTDLPVADRQRLFAAATARALNKQLSFDHGAHAETEATVARLDIPFEALWRPRLDRFWSQMRKGEMLAIARRTLGPEWATAHAKDKKQELAEAMAAAFGHNGEAESLGLTPAGRAAALGWTPAGFRAFDPARPPEEDDAADASSDAEPAETGDDKPPAEASTDAAGTAEADRAGAAGDDDADTGPTTDGALNGKLLRHPSTVPPNGNGAPLDDSDETGDDDATPFEHGPIDELPPFLQEQEQ
ncbi:MAG: ParB/RepB/Spo0J family partition protein [Acidobacteria bacterium]|nr:ParB/RepB/Spo0J family partition protein [Acidobacteriota bacterium]